jgi:hypothetical protein
VSEFKGFSEAAQLYVKNLNIVNAMKEVFERDIVSYLDALADSIRDRLDTGSLNDQITSGYRRWWIGKEGESCDKQLRVWFRSKPIEVLAEDKLVLNVYAQDPIPERLAMITRIPELDEFRSFCRLGRDRWTLVEACIKCDASDLVSGPSSQIAELLCELHRIDGDFRDQ